MFFQLPKEIIKKIYLKKFILFWSKLFLFCLETNKKIYENDNFYYLIYKKFMKQIKTVTKKIEFGF